jgi:hypothetical protein
VSLGGALQAGGSPRDWRRGIAGAVEPTADFGAVAVSLVALAGERPTIFPAPHFESVIDAVLAHADVHALPDEARSQRPRDRARPDSGANTVAASPQEAAAYPRTVPATGEGGLSPEQTSRSSRANPTGLTAAAVRGLPHRIDRALLARRAGPGFAAGGPVTAAPAMAGAGARTKPVRTPPAPGGHGSAVASLVEKIAERLGGASADGLHQVLRSVPRPGPAAPATTLTRLLFDEARRVAAEPAAIERAEPPTGTDESNQAAGGLRAADATRSDGPAEAEVHEPLAAAPQPVDPNRDASTPAASTEGRDVTVVRHVTSHHELPEVPRRERSSAHARRVDPGIERPGPVAVDNGDDLERRMKQILDEAARRHGIDV